MLAKTTKGLSPQYPLLDPGLAQAPWLPEDLGHSQKQSGFGIKLLIPVWGEVPSSASPLEGPLKLRLHETKA